MKTIQVLPYDNPFETRKEPHPHRLELLDAPVTSPYQYNVAPNACQPIPFWYQDYRLSDSDERSAYLDTEFTVKDLIGTQWRNLYSGNFCSVQSLVADFDGYPCPNGSQAICPPGGIWEDNKLCIDHWIEVSDCTIEQHYQWHLHYYRYKLANGYNADGGTDKAKQSALDWANLHQLDSLLLYQIEVDVTGRCTQIGLF